MNWKETNNWVSKFLTTNPAFWFTLVLLNGFLLGVNAIAGNLCGVTVDLVILALSVYMLKKTLVEKDIR